MSRNTLVGMFTCALVFLAAGAMDAGAATLTYPGAAPCNTTLQLCADGAVAGDTVSLATNTPIAEFITIDRSLIVQPAAGFTPHVQGLFVLATTTNVDVTIQRIGANSIEGRIGFGGGNLTLRVLNNTIDAAQRSAITVQDGSAAGTYGTKTLIATGNTITQNSGFSSCADAIIAVGTSTGFDATIVGNNITANNLSQCGGVVAVVGAGQSGTARIERNIVHGVDFDLGIEARNFGNNVGQPGGLLTATIVGNLVYGQNGNTGAPAGIVLSADGNNASVDARVINNTVADGRLGVLVSARTDLGANITGGLFNNIVAFHSQGGISIDTGLGGFTNGFNLAFANNSEFFTAGPGTRFSDPAFVNRPAGNYRLTPLSEAINQGSNALLPIGYTVDLDGAPRVQGGVVDMGAYESTIVAAASAIPTLDGKALLALSLLLLALGMTARRSMRR